MTNLNQNINPSKEILKINIFWMLIIYICVSILSFYFSTTLGIVMFSISLVSFICYIVIGHKMKKIMKEKKNYVQGY